MSAYDGAVLDPVQLRSFCTVARVRSFTGAARVLGVGQSTVSQHVRRLEATVGRPLLERDTHTVALTADGEAMLEFATTILDAGDRALAHFRASRVHGRVRFGVSEDLVLTRLPAILPTSGTGTPRSTSSSASGWPAPWRPGSTPAGWT